MASRRKKKAFRFTAPAILALVAVFVVSIGIGSVGMSTASRMSQFALVKEADAKCTPDKDYTYPCDKVNPKTKKKGGKDCPCPDMTNGHETPGKCQGPNICKGEPPGGGKMPELPKMEPPKSEPKPPGEPKKDDNPCSAQNSFGGGVPDQSARDAEGKPCPNSTLGGTLLGNLLGVDTTPTTPEEDAAPPEDDNPKRPFSWSAVGRVIQDATKAASDAVGGVFGNSDGTDRRILYPNPDAVRLQAGNTSGDGSAGGRIGGTSASFFTSPELHTFGQPVQSGTTAEPSGFWGGLAQALKNFLTIF